MDDFRFNITKVKWMLLSLLAPEFILAKALAEFLAARKSRRDFGHPKDWTATHGFFANMRGFVLRFNVAAVPTSIEPVPPDAIGRSRYNPRLDGDPPYFPQILMEAEAEELKHCRDICGDPCGNGPTQTNAGSSPDSAMPAASAQTPSNTITARVEPPELKIEIEGPSETTTQPGVSISLSDHYSGDFMAFTPRTLVNNTPVSLIKSHDELVNEKTRSTSPVSASAEKARLGPHRTWRATWALSSMQMLYAYREGIIPLPDVSAEDLNDRSKGDALVKGAAVLQITWLVIQIIARASQHLAISQLEITTFAFAACAIITWILLWHKPQDVKVPTYVDISKTLSREQIIQLAARAPVSTLMVHQFWLHGVAIRTMADNVFPWTPGIKVQIPGIMKEPVFLNNVFVGIGLGGAVFGGVHFVAWDFHFPSSVECLLWRVSCIYLITSPFFGASIYCLAQHYARMSASTDTKADNVLRPIGRVAIPLYLLARLYLIVEVFRCLAYPPLSIFQDVNWPSFIPHVY